MNAIFSKRALACGALLFYFTLGAHAQAAQGGQDAVQSESSIVLEQEATDSPAAYQSSNNGAGALVRVVLVLLLVCAGLWGIMNLLKKSTRFNAADDPYLKVLASLPLSATQSVRVVSVGDRAFNRPRRSFLHSFDGNNRPRAYRFHAAGILPDRRAAVAAVFVFDRKIFFLCPSLPAKKNAQTERPRKTTTFPTRQPILRIFSGDSGNGSGIRAKETSNEKTPGFLRRSLSPAFRSHGDSPGSSDRRFLSLGSRPGQNLDKRFPACGKYSFY